MNIYARVCPVCNQKFEGLSDRAVAWQLQQHQAWRHPGE